MRLPIRVIGTLKACINEVRALWNISFQTGEFNFNDWEDVFTIFDFSEQKE